MVNGEYANVKGKGGYVMNPYIGLNVRGMDQSGFGAIARSAQNTGINSDTLLSLIRWMTPKDTQAEPTIVVNALKIMANHETAKIENFLQDLSKTMAQFRFDLRNSEEGLTEVYNGLRTGLPPTFNPLSEQYQMMISRIDRTGFSHPPQENVESIELESHSTSPVTLDKDIMEELPKVTSSKEKQTIGITDVTPLPMPSKEKDVVLDSSPSSVAKAQASLLVKELSAYCLGESPVTKKGIEKIILAHPYSVRYFAEQLLFGDSGEFLDKVDESVQGWVPDALRTIETEEFKGSFGWNAGTLLDQMNTSPTAKLIFQLAERSVPDFKIYVDNRGETESVPSKGQIFIRSENLDRTPIPNGTAMENLLNELWNIAAQPLYRALDQNYQDWSKAQFVRFMEFIELMCIEPLAKSHEEGGHVWGPHEMLKEPYREKTSKERVDYQLREHPEHQGNFKSRFDDLQSRKYKYKFDKSLQDAYGLMKDLFLKSESGKHVSFDEFSQVFGKLS